MDSAHIEDGTVKRYLLGTLDVAEAAAIEELYFTDPAFFEQLRKSEILLICNYLDGTLSANERVEFESRYLQLPHLRQLVEKVSEQRAVVAVPAQPRIWPAAAVAALACVIVLGLVILRKRQPAVELSSANPHPATITLFLEPGVTKGAAAQAKQLTPPPSVQMVALIAELPGQSSSSDYTATVFNIDRDGERKKIFAGNGIRSAPRPGGQQVAVTLSSALLSPGDYVLEVAMERGSVRETYVFKVASSPQ